MLRNTMPVLIVILIPANARAIKLDKCESGVIAASNCQGVTWEGCCTDEGQVVYCEDGKLMCLACASSPSCGWSEQAAFYDCGTTGAEDPSGEHPKSCPESSECVPWCQGKSCGPDGCGGSCGECQPGQICLKSGHCCEPDCAGKQCGSDGCSGECGKCPAGTVCAGNSCCTPSCAGLECGFEPCAGWSCGDYGKGFFCSDSGSCLSCVPDCGGKECGPDGCGGSCGGCGEGKACTLDQQCAACAEECEGKQCGPDGCGGSCGECDVGAACKAGQCVACAATCDGMECGSDGCGGSCGGCAGGDVCISGHCEPLDGGCLEAMQPGCNGCACEECVCSADAACCEYRWDAKCVSECESCGGCEAPEPEPDAGVVEAGGADAFGEVSGADTVPGADSNAAIADLAADSGAAGVDGGPEQGQLGTGKPLASNGGGGSSGGCDAAGQGSLPGWLVVLLVAALPRRLRQGIHF